MGNAFFVARGSNDNMLIGNKGLSEPAIEIDSKGIVTEPHKPFFSACLRQTQHRQTSQGNPARLIPDTFYANKGDYFNTTTAEFKTPKDGVYFISARALLTNLSSERTNAVMSIFFEDRDGNIKQFQEVNTSRDPHPYTISASVTEMIAKGTAIWVEISSAVQGFAPTQLVGFGGNESTCVSGISGVLL